MRLEINSRLVLFVATLSMLVCTRAPASFDRAALLNPNQSALVPQTPPASSPFRKITRGSICAAGIAALALVTSPWRMWMHPNDNESDIVTYNLTLPLSPDSVIYPGDPRPVFNEPPRQLFGKVKVKLSTVELPIHVGTHVDAPAHFLDDSDAPMVDQIPLHVWVGKMQVIDLSHCGKRITRADLEAKASLIREGAKIFLKTSNSPGIIRSNTFEPDHAFLDVSAAKYLVERKIALLGFDYYSVDSSRDEGNLDSHVEFAMAHVPVIVNVDLTDLSEKTYHYTATPLQWKLEASQVTVIAYEYPR